MAATTFHPFMLLPLELRQRIWELSMEPRWIPLRVSPSPVPPPAVLQVCAEARSYLERYYSKAFATESPSRYTWVNFDMDTIFTRQETIPDFWAELRSVKHLSIQVDDETHDAHEFFFQKISITSEDCPLLENLEIRPFHVWYDDWWLAWDQYMEECYYNDHPVRFRMTVVCPIPGDPIPEFNQDNYLKLTRDRIRRIIREDPEERPGFSVPMDSDDEDPCLPGWRHAPECACPPSLRWAPRY